MSVEGKVPVVGVLTLTEKRDDIDRFIKNIEKGDTGRIQFQKHVLKLEQLNKENLKDLTDGIEIKSHELSPYEWKGMTLLHSRYLGRISLTDVADARYDNVLCNFQELKESERKMKICIIVHDVNGWDAMTDNIKEEYILNLKHSQGSAFKYADEVIICDQLAKLKRNNHGNQLDKYLCSVYGEKHTSSQGEQKIEQVKKESGALDGNDDGDEFANGAKDSQPRTNTIEMCEEACSEGEFANGAKDSQPLCTMEICEESKKTGELEDGAKDSKLRDTSENSEEDHIAGELEDGAKDSKPRDKPENSVEDHIADPTSPGLCGGGSRQKYGKPVATRHSESCSLI